MDGHDRELEHFILAAAERIIARRVEEDTSDPELGRYWKDARAKAHEYLVADLQSYEELMRAPVAWTR